jgi:hypothetical protein
MYLLQCISTHNAYTIGKDAVIKHASLLSKIVNQGSQSDIEFVMLITNGFFAS